MTSADAAKSDQSILEQLNREYVSAFMNSDVNWYDQHLSDDFVCIESDGSVLNKTQFLKNVSGGPDVAEYKLAEVNIRIYGGVALVQATGHFTRLDGISGVSRYIDVYVYTGDGWKTVSAQITRKVPVRNALGAPN